MDLDLINIIREPREVPASKRHQCRLDVFGATTLEKLTRMIEGAQKELREKHGMTHFALEFEAASEESGAFCRVCVRGTRMETLEEAAERIARQEAYNQAKLKAYSEKLETAERQLQMRRILGHLTTAELARLAPINKPEGDPT